MEPSTRSRQDISLQAPLHQSTTEHEEVVVTFQHLASCSRSLNNCTEENVLCGALASVLQCFCRALAILLLTRVGRTLRKTNSLETLVLRAARYTSNLDSDIDCDCIFAIYSGNSTIHQGILRLSGTRVAIKTIKRAGADSDMIKKTLREVHVWSKLRHDNVLPLLGITTLHNQMVSIVTTWMPGGNAHNYVQDPSVDPRPLILDIACGLSYLHSYDLGPIIHGDLKGVNVLISEEGRARLTDFGLAHLTNSSFSMTADLPHGGTLNWLAPENVDSGECTAPGDVWAFGMTALELFSRRNPFHGIKRSPAVLKRICFGPLPDRPNDLLACSRMSDAWWNMCNLCWERDVLLRPNMLELMVIIDGCRDLHS